MDFNLARKGYRCPSCNRFVKIYRRKLNCGQVRGLIWIVRNWTKTQDWACINQVAPKSVLQNREWGRCKEWGFIVQKPNGDLLLSKDSGLWKPTILGIEFVDGLRKAPEWLDIYNNRIVGASDKMIGIREALGTKFDYGELMGNNLDDWNDEDPRS